MNMDAELTYRKDGRLYSAKVKLASDQRAFRLLSSPLAMEILRAAGERQLYARELAKTLRVSEQTVYYHVKRLIRASLLEVVGTNAIRGAVAKKVACTSDGLVILYKAPAVTESPGDLRLSPLASFFREFISDHTFNGYLVVGSPEPHGPFRAAARDGHYAAQLSFALGSFVMATHDFCVRLDTDVKAEKAYESNMILFGGPATNVLTADVNKHLPVRFDETNYWAGLMDDVGRRFNGETDAVVAKVPNPFSPSHSVVVLAGIRHVGTKSAIVALTKQHDEVLAGYSGQRSFARVVKGYDQDGDGKVDRVDVLARYP